MTSIAGFDKFQDLTEVLKVGEGLGAVYGRVSTEVLLPEPVKHISMSLNSVGGGGCSL